jgi:hypothetical protein
MVAYHAADLLWQTRIKATGQDVGVECRPVRSVEMLEARLGDSVVRGLIVDLESPEVSLALIGAMRGGGGKVGRDPERRVRIIAFGPHVSVELFEAARVAGADQVLARGAFDRRIGEILRELDGTTENSGDPGA